MASPLLVAQYKVRAVVEGKRNRFMAVLAVTAAPLHTTPSAQHNVTFQSPFRRINVTIYITNTRIKTSNFMQHSTFSFEKNPLWKENLAPILKLPVPVNSGLALPGARPILPKPHRQQPAAFQTQVRQGALLSNTRSLTSQAHRVVLGVHHHHNHEAQIPNRLHCHPFSYI